MTINFSTIEEIGRGGFSKVEKVSLEDGTLCARKVFYPRLLEGPGASFDKLKKRFRREVSVQKNLPDGYFMPILGEDLDADEPYYLMPLAQQTLTELIDESKNKGDLTSCIEALKDLLNGLEEIHQQGFVHRDIKPDNVLLYDGSWRLTDFGFVLHIEAATNKITSVGSKFGTEYYMAPEQLLAAREATTKADIYAFGCILHDIFSEETRTPYQTYSCKGPMGVVIERCTDKNPERRFRTVSDLRSAMILSLNNINLETGSNQTNDWVSELGGWTNWNADKLDDLVRFILACEDEQMVSPIFYEVNEQMLEKFFELEKNLWSSLIGVYCEWVKSNRFIWDFCDVIIGRLMDAYRLGAESEKAKTTLAAASLAHSHNRYHVMRRLFRMAGPEISTSLASRLRVEILAEGCQDDFIYCTETLDKELSEYHASIVEILRDYKKKISEKKERERRLLLESVEKFFGGI